VVFHRYPAQRVVLALRVPDPVVGHLDAGQRGVTIEHDAAVALGDKLEIISHVHPAGSTEKFGAELADRTVRTLTYTVGEETKAIAAIFAL